MRTWTLVVRPPKGMMNHSGNDGTWIQVLWISGLRTFFVHRSFLANSNLGPYQTGHEQLMCKLLTTKLTLGEWCLFGVPKRHQNVRRVMG